MRERKNEKPVAFNRSDRTIYPEKRGGRKSMPVASVIFIALGILCLLYCISIGLFMGYGTNFFLIWGVGGVCLTALGWLIGQEKRMKALPGWLKAGAVIMGSVCLIIFLVVEGLILSQFGAQAPDGADYCIILGAQMKTHGPSDVLRRRLDTAIEYLDTNPDTAVIVSGGQGANEPMPEAQGMYEYLVEKGIDEERILMEANSGNTWGNLHYSSAFLNPAEDSVALVTNNFHVFRATGIARKMGYEKVSGLAADSYPLMVPNNLLREFFGVIKDFLVGNL